jgi:DNA-binding NtrC family response regulator
VTDSKSFILGSSPYARSQRAWALKWARETDCPLAIIGPTGTGKTFLARELHGLSGLAGRYVRVPIPQLEPTLVRTELRGNVKGAFTGAENREGFVRSADRGTLYIDELQDTLRDAQGVLLDVCEGEPLRKLGEDRDYLPNCRLIVSSQRPLWDLVDEEILRKDLAERLTVECIVLAPLREHVEDLDQFVPIMLAALGARGNRAMVPMSEDAMSVLKAHSWPGNLRELQNTLLRSLIEAKGCSTIEVKHLPPRVFGGNAAPALQMIDLPTLVRQHGTIKAVAKLKGVHPRTISRQLQRLAGTPPSEN